MKTIKSTLLLTLCAWLAATAPATALQAPVEEPSTEKVGAAPAIPGTLDISTGRQILTDAAGEAMRTIKGLEDLDGLREEIDDAERRQAELATLLASMTASDLVRLERLSRVRDQAHLEDRRIAEVGDRLTERLTILGNVHNAWRAHREIWRSRLNAARAEPDLAGAEPDVRTALRRIEHVLDRVTDVATRALALQGRADTIRRELARLDERLGTIQARHRESLLERTQPLIFSAEHRAQLREGGWRAWDPTSDIDPASYRSFAIGNAGMLGIHLLLAVMIGAAGRAGRRRAARTGHEEWSALLERPWALGAFASVALAIARIALAPPLWDVLMWVLFGLTAAVLARRLVAQRAFRMVIYLVSAFYPVFLLLEVAGLPDPVFRVGLALVAASAIPFFLLLARGEHALAAERSGKGDARHVWPLRIGAGLWIWVLLTLALGFDTLARWTVHAIVVSGAVTFALVLGFVLVAAAAGSLSRLDLAGSLLRRAGVLVAQRATLLARIALVAVAALLLLDIWGVTASPVATWHRIMGADLTVGTLQITLGRVLLGGLVVYASVLVSGLARTLALGGLGKARSGESAEGRVHGDHALIESMTNLGRYGVVALGLIVGLAVMGMELRNFAIVAGALGIGLGFGLQNVVNNFASGLILLFERPVRVGDTVVVGDVLGTVQKIGLRSTVLLTLDQSEMIVPNGDIVSEKVVNWTLTSPIARVFLPVGVAYGSSVTDVLALLEGAASTHAGVLKDPPPEALFLGFGESALNFELRVWVQDIRLRMETRSTILASIDRCLREAGIEIPFPQRDLHLRSIAPEVMGQLDRRKRSGQGPALGRTVV